MSDPREGEAPAEPPCQRAEPMIIILMGVAGAGKSTVGRILAQDLGWEFHDADDVHSTENVGKMASGIPLTDGDREPWLTDLRMLVKRLDDERRSAVLACSALTESFRRRLASASSKIVWVYLRDTPENLERRLEGRDGHFMKSTMLSSQIATLEEPSDAITIDVGDGTPAEVAAKVRESLEL